MAYATTTDLARLGIAAAALSGVSSTIQEAALDAASVVADGYLRSRYTVPLASWGDDLTRAVCAIAAWDVLCTRGFDPTKGGDAAIEARAIEARGWLKDVSAGRVILSGGNTDPTASRHARASAPRVSSDRTRGW